MESVPPNENPDRLTQWTRVAELIEVWYGVSRPPSVDPSDLLRAERRLGFQLPPAIREWYSRFGHLVEVWNVQDVALTLQELTVDDGCLIVARENQGVFSWGVRLAMMATADPEVVIFAPNDDNHLDVAAPSFTDFAVRWLLLNAKFSQARVFRANGQVPDAVVAAIENRLPRLPIPDISWHVSPMRLFGNANVIVEVDASTWLWVTAVNPQAFEAVVQFAAHFGMDWEEIERPT